MDEDKKRVNLLFANAHRKGIGIQVGGGESCQRLQVWQVPHMHHSYSIYFLSFSIL